jgi:hypothetical protein
VGSSNYHFECPERGVPQFLHRLERCDHSLTVKQWGQLLAAKAPTVYASPPLPSRPLPRALPLEQRLLAYRARVRAGRQWCHPADPPPVELAGVDMTDVPGFLARLVVRRC